MMKSGVRVMLALVLGALALASGCGDHKTDVQTGTRTVDARGNVVIERIRTLQVPAETAIGYHVTTMTIPPFDLEGVATLYARAQEHITSSETSMALKRLERLLKVVPDYRNAVGQRDAIRRGASVKADPGWLPGPKTDGFALSGKQGQNAGSLLRWMPDRLEGFAAGKPVANSLTALRDYAPATASPARVLAIVAEQYSSPGEASASLEALVKRRYPKSSASVPVNGHDVYFGTDGSNLGVVAFTSGSVMVAVEAAPTAGSPAGLQATLIAVARQLP
jgi:hypothetical protein